MIARYPRDEPRPGFRPALTAPPVVVSILVVLAVVASLAVPSARATPPSGWTIVNTATTDAPQSPLLMDTACTGTWNCWAVGASFPTGINGQPQSLTEHWNGSSWVVVPATDPDSPAVSLLWGVTCVTSSDCWAVGGQSDGGSPSLPVPLTEHWDGSSWTVVPAPSAPGYLFSVTCVTGSDCWAAGATVVGSGNGTANGVIDHWDGSAWTTVATASSGQAYDQFNTVTCAGASDCWAVGYAAPSQVQYGFLPPVAPNVAGSTALVEHFDGIGWTTVGTPAPAAPDGPYLSGVTCTSSSHCVAVGSTMDAAGDPSTALVDQWDGSSWSTVPSADTPTGFDLLSEVSCLDASNCWAVGADGVEQNGQGVNPQSFIEHWDGSTWSVDPSPGVTAWSYLSGVACVRRYGCFADGFSITNGNTAQFGGLMEQLLLPPAGHQGLVASASDGGVFTFGDATFHGSQVGTRLNAPVAGMASTPDGGGYWLVGSDGGVFSFGDAAFHGGTGGTRLNAPITGMASTPDGRGYWLVGSDGGVFSFGDAAFHGGTGGARLNAPIVGMAATPDGGGYWLVGSDGGVFSFGDATFFGSEAGAHLGAPVVGVATTPDGSGYWLVASDGGVFAFGDATYEGSVPGQGILHHAPVVGLTATPDGGGYWIVGSDGAVYTYGDATFMGSLAGTRLSGPVTASAPG